jgi:Arc/MetJ family transcription regulator
MAHPMRTNIVIDEDVMARAKELTGLSSKRAVVDEALRTLVDLREQEGVRELRGALRWEGDLGEMRRDRGGDSR